MNRKRSRTALAVTQLALAVLAGLGATHVQAQAPASPPPVADFFRQPQISSAVLSPDGTKVALVVFNGDDSGRLAVFDLAQPDKLVGLAGFDQLDVSNVRWVSNKRLVYSVSDTQRRMAWGIAPGLWAVDVDGDNKRQLAYVDNNKVMVTGTNLDPRILDWNWYFHSTLNDGSDDILVQRVNWDNRGDQIAATGLARLNTRTAVLRTLVKNPPADTSEWFTDEKGTPVVALSETKSLSAFHLAQADGSWKKIYETDAFTSNLPSPLALDAKGALWLVGPDVDGKTDTGVLMRYDIQNPGAKPQVILNLKNYDFSGWLVTERGTREVLGVHYDSDAPGTHWFNAKMKAMQADVDEQLSSTSNVIICERCLEAENVLVMATSDRQPPVLLRYQPATRKLNVLTASMPQIKVAQMGEREPFTITARDGMRMPVMVTFPPGLRKKGPAVVLVHGGPWERGAHWAWDAKAQFLASRGYVVIEPEFRGSTGYGYRHFAASFREWGLKMQDDVTDAGDWAVAQGFADAKRMCIAGASYGGYATLMGLARYGDRYQCGINWVGVTDLDLQYTSVLSDTPERYRRYGLPKMLGDKGSQQLKDTSPVNLAARITKPVLMAYGGEDRRVPIEHGDKMRDALAAAGNKNVEWVVYPGEGHTWARLSNKVDFWTRVEKFLDRHIGAGAQAK